MSKQEISTGWSRRHLLIVLGTVVGVAMLLVVGLVYAVGLALGTTASPEQSITRSPDKQWPTNASGVRGKDYRDWVAAEPMLKASADDMTPSAPAAGRPGRMLIELSTQTGPTDVLSGFDHTPAGAVAQLAAIEIATLVPMSIEYARDVHQSWAMAGASFARWEIAESIRAFHTSAGTVDGDGATTVSATPAGAQIKGTDGPDWVLACVQLDVTAIVSQQIRFGYGHCERMQWTDGRWMIASGAPPAQAPSTWPASQRSREAGWLLWVDNEAH